MGVACCGVGNAGAEVGVYARYWLCGCGGYGVSVGSAVPVGAGVVLPVRCGRYGVQYPSESSTPISSCFRCGCGGAVAGRCTVGGLVKGVGEVWWDAVLVSISIRGGMPVWGGVRCSHAGVGCPQWWR